MSTQTSLNSVEFTDLAEASKDAHKSSMYSMICA